MDNVAGEMVPIFMFLGLTVIISLFFWFRYRARGEMQQDPISGTWSICLRLPSGNYQYRYVIDGEWITDPANEMHEIGETGFRNSLVMVGGMDE